MADAATKEFVEQFVALMDKFKGAIWNEAFKAGGEAMRDSILRAAQSPVATATPGTSALPPNSLSAVAAAAAIQRAPRGSVGKAIDTVLSEKPGMLVPELEEAVLQADPEIAKKSVGNELRRMEGNKYKRDRPRGYRWFLIDQPVDQEIGEPTPQTAASDIFHGKRL
jgi:hypothetical protein